MNEDHDRAVIAARGRNCLPETVAEQIPHPLRPRPASGNGDSGWSCLRFGMALFNQ